MFIRWGETFPQYGDERFRDDVHFPPEDIKGVYAFIDVEGCVNSELIPIQQLYNAFKDVKKNKVKIINLETKTRNPNHAIIYTPDKIKTIWCKIYPNGLGADEWVEYKNINLFINAFCERGDMLLEINGEDGWPWDDKLFPDEYLEEVFLELK